MHACMGVQQKENSFLSIACNPEARILYFMQFHNHGPWKSLKEFELLNNLHQSPGRTWIGISKSSLPSTQWPMRVLPITRKTVFAGSRAPGRGRRETETGWIAREAGKGATNEICGTPLLLPQLTFLTVESRNTISLDYRERTSSPRKILPHATALCENCSGRRKKIYRYVYNYLHQTEEARARLLSPFLTCWPYNIMVEHDVDILTSWWRNELTGRTIDYSFLKNSHFT